ncbi:UdgX family uracil-DNA binding protein [Aestuariibius sp. 2305UL40-4]|uniref:UdgX family uracil-DNA binding protein n=1 Tax=Aestuariibius violaceus TaxID=3234132 RepID=UPI00345E0F56
MQQVALPRIGPFARWRDSARDAAAMRLRPERIDWFLEGEGGGLFVTETGPLPEARHKVRATKSFLGLAETVIWHSDRDRFSRLYRLLLRLQAEPRLMADRGDPEVAHLERLAKAVRRDMHKMKAFVRFREVDGMGARRSFVAWFEPDHHICEPIAGFFARRFADMDWVIATPEMSIHHVEGAVTLDPTPPERPRLADATEDLWRTYYASIFNPARLKVKAMTSEMPKKYWRNLPEAELIPQLIANAEARSRAMQEAAPTLPAAGADRISARVREVSVTEPATSLEALEREAHGCARCPLHGCATQLVFGEGPAGADLMVVGEQPGDREDLAGRPFVGPAGQLFDQLAGRAGLDRQASYVTNAVKHFKFTIRGKRRIHQSPATGEIDQCRWWLEQEIALVRPKLILAMGATALRALTGNGAGILKRRGGIEAGLSGHPVFVTVHPSFILRVPADRRQAEEAAFVADLTAAMTRLPALTAAQ